MVITDAKETNFIVHKNETLSIAARLNLRKKGDLQLYEKLTFIIRHPVFNTKVLF